MLSPKMQHRIQRSVRINDGQLLGMAEKARYDSRLSGFLYKRCSDSNKWLLRWFRLYQNLLFYYDNDQTSRPIGIIFLEGCYCERVLSATATKADRDEEKMHCFAIMYRRENQRQYEMRANSASECQAWIESIKMASFNKLHLLMEELEQKHLHLLQVVESEKTAKWQYTQHCEELTEEIKKLRNELNVMKKEWRLLPQMSKSTTSSQDSDRSEENNEDPDIAKIKKVQSFFRGWLCRRRWKQIVDEYIRSPHAESMRKRNCLVFRMVESEEEYVDQLEILISCFLRPFKMAASSKNPPCTHEDINSIFLNSETVLFLHQIFLKGLTARMESWPTLVLGDLFDMLLPMLTIYQEYVRNHHYSLQVLTECKQGQMFASLLSRLEKKPACKGRSLETFLTYPMHQIPRYIITLHELLAHTPPDHVEKKSLENARDQLEDLSRQMHDEVSETENIRKNLAIERMIVEGCDILLDVNQIFVRQGTLVQIMSPGQRGTTRSRSIFGHEKEREEIRQCFLFSNHLILTSRNQSGGRLHLVEGVGKIPLADITLIEDPNEEDRPDVESSSSSSNESLSDLSSVSTEHKALDFKLIVDDVKTGQQMTVHLVAPTRQEKAAWITDISQCMDNVHFNGLFYNTMPNASSSTLPQCVKSDPNLFKDDAEIRFSKTFNNCKIPQIRYATPDRLLQRLTDLRFLNIDFLNTFLLTYRVFTDAITVLEALKKVFFDPDPPDSPTSSNGSLENLHLAHHNAGSHRQSCGGFSTCCGVPPASVCTEAPAHIMHASAAVATGVAAPCAVTDPGGHGGIHHSAASCEGKRRISTCSGYSTATENAARHGSLTPSSRRISGASSIVSGYYSDDRERNSFSQESTGNYFLSGNHPKTQHWRYSFRKYEEEQRESQNNSNNEGLGVPGSRWSMNSGANKNTNSSTGSVGMGGRKGSHDSRSGSIASTSANLPPWQRKESVTIIERAEDEKDAEDEQRLEKTAKLNVDMSATTSAGPIIRRASSVGEHSDDQFLTVPKSITASSSAETLTDTTLSGPPTPTNLTKVISASSISQTTVVAVPRASGSRSSSGGGTSTSEQLSLDREDDDGNEDLKMDEEPKLVDPAPAAPEPEKDFNDDIMVKMKKDPDPDAYQPIRKKSGPDLQDIKRGLTGGASQQLGTNLKPEHQYKGHKKTSLPTLPSHALCGNSSAGRCRNRSTSTFSTASSASACLAAAFHHTHHHRGHHAHHHYSGQSGGGDGSDMICMMGGSVSQPCSHHPSFSGPTTGKGLFGVLSFKDLTAGLKSPTKEFKKRKGLFQSAASSTNSRCGGDDVPCGSPLSSPQHSKMGVVITSSRQAHRRSSSASAAVAFAVATAGSGNPPDLPMRHKEAFKEAARRKCSITSNASTMRVVSVLRHWVTKHAQDFETNSRLKNLTIEFLEDIICTPSLLPSEHRAASQLLRMLTKEEPAQNIIDLESILAPTAVGTKDSIMTLSALEIAEQMTWLDQKILFTIMSSEFLGQAWTKPDKATRSPNICTITKRFNDMSRLVSTEIITQPCMTTRVQCIEKWAAVADICKCLHNFNGVLQICSALTNSSVYRLRNTWNRVSKSSRQTVEKLQNLVSSDGRFRNLRDSLHRTDPPCIPYLGMYLSDLTFIEEGTPNFTDNGLLNFAKMRMIAHVVREIRQFQQTPYKIEKIQKVLNYLLDTARLLDDEELYHRSLVVEPRTSRLSSSFGHGFATASVTMAVAAAAAAAAANSSSPKSSNH